MNEVSFLSPVFNDSKPITTIEPFLKVNLMKPSSTSADNTDSNSTSSVSHILAPSCSTFLNLKRDLDITSSIHSSGGEGSGPVHTNPPFHEKKYIPRFACSSHGNILKVTLE